MSRPPDRTGSRPAGHPTLLIAIYLRIVSAAKWGRRVEWAPVGQDKWRWARGQRDANRMPNQTQAPLAWLAARSLARLAAGGRRASEAGQMLAKAARDLAQRSPD